MFTGLIEEIGKIKSIKQEGGGYRITVAVKKIGEDLKIDDSIAINGACQTVVACNKNYFEVVAVEETLRKTNFNELCPETEVNLERALKLSDRLGGHVVQGHVDCTATVNSIQKERTGINLWISFPLEFSKYLVNTGSICINGVSLTTAKVEQDRFMVSIIPHTWDNTTFRNVRRGEKVNLEFDILGKYTEKLLEKIVHYSLGNSKSILDDFIDQPEF